MAPRWPLLRGSEPKTYSVETDQLGAPRLVRDENKKARWLWEPDPFGVKPPTNDPSGMGPFTVNLRFPGQVLRQGEQSPLQLASIFRAG